MKFVKNTGEFKGTILEMQCNYYKLNKLRIVQSIFISLPIVFFEREDQL